MQYQITPITEPDAYTVLGWQYSGPYAVYNADETTRELEVDWLTNAATDYHVAHNKAGELIGFFCFGEDAQISGGDYTTEALDVGIGMAPELMGQGQGTNFLKAILEFARREFAPRFFRATIATFNQRSQRTFAKAGFRDTQTFVSKDEQPLEFVVMTCMA